VNNLDLFIAVFEEPDDPESKTYFHEIIASISDIEFSRDGRYLVSRDYLSIKVRNKSTHRLKAPLPPTNDCMRQTSTFMHVFYLSVVRRCGT
jgi:serine/threonine-protein phosphatase 2A regulatory subunit B